MRWFAAILGGILIGIGVWALLGGAITFVETYERVALAPVVALVGVLGGLALLAVGVSAAGREVP